MIEISDAYTQEGEAQHAPLLAGFFIGADRLILVTADGF